MSATGKLDRPGGRFHFVGESGGGTLGLLLGSRRPDALPSLTVSNASHRGRSIQRAREWREFILANGMARWGEMMTPLRIDRERVTEAQYRWFVPRAVMEEMHAGIAASELVVFPDARHGLPCSHGAACGRALRTFLDRRAA